MLEVSYTKTYINVYIRSMYIYYDCSATLAWASTKFTEVESVTNENTANHVSFAILLLCTSEIFVLQNWLADENSFSLLALGNNILEI